jgi:Uma2 family endonuclease
MSALTTPTRFTPDDLLRMPDGNATELVAGQLRGQTVSKESVRVAASVAAVLWQAVRSTRDVEVYGSDLGYRCFRSAPNDVRKPDVSLIRRERLAALDDPDPGFMPIPADLAVEVLSPNDLARDIDEKVKLYLDNGFGVVWVVNPGTRTVLIRRADGSVSILGENDQITGERFLPGFQCRVGEFFS